MLDNRAKRRKNNSVNAKNIALSKGRLACPDLFTATNAALKKAALWTTVRNSAATSASTGTLSLGLKMLLIVTVNGGRTNKLMRGNNRRHYSNIAIVNEYYTTLAIRIYQTKQIQSLSTPYKPKYRVSASIDHPLSGQCQAGESNNPCPSTCVCPRLFSKAIELHSSACSSAAISRVACETTQIWVACDALMINRASAGSKSGCRLVSGSFSTIKSQDIELKPPFFSLKYLRQHLAPFQPTAQFNSVLTLTPSIKIKPDRNA